MRAYPDWDMKFMDGNDVHFQYKALAGDPLYYSFWERVTFSRDSIVFDNVIEGILGWLNSECFISSYEVSDLL